MRRKARSLATSAQRTSRLNSTQSKIWTAPSWLQADMLGTKIAMSFANPPGRGSRLKKLIPFGNELPHCVDHESELDGSKRRSCEWRQLIKVVGHDPRRRDGVAGVWPH